MLIKRYHSTTINRAGFKYAVEIYFSSNRLVCSYEPGGDLTTAVAFVMEAYGQQRTLQPSSTGNYANTSIAKAIFTENTFKILLDFLFLYKYIFYLRRY